MKKVAIPLMFSVFSLLIVRPITPSVNNFAGNQPHTLIADGSPSPAPKPTPKPRQVIIIADGSPSPAPKPTPKPRRLIIIANHELSS
jgi:hypothetical protein